ncbi:MAG: hypothetical protein KA362_11155 [Chloroflexi bacterium]|jgi:hypothetical protein|nr:hypothetical protein [Chloroflexota bacterium]MBK6710993.1 hypothetical protein [Chloroflexota bacterium]MBK7177924.1 hypothetical protein [Chloroflexota bacterium]MBK7916133.1 hypothetical protein [Chloroflexota bacterium]MBK8930886.1 hypothetical protein [Chloroflexota bacterium]
MATRSKQGIGERLMAAQVAIDAVLGDGALQAALTPFGYGPERMAAGRVLFEETEALQQAQQREYGEQFGATAALEAVYAAADTAYTRSLKLARVAFKGDVRAQQGLGLNGRRKKSVSGWAEQALQFYASLLQEPDFLAAMAPFGYDAAKAQAEMDLVTAVRAANVTQENEKGDAQKATQLRDAKLDELDDWLADFKAVAEVALADDAQQLEKMGFGAV